MKDPRFLPVEKHDPVEEYDDDILPAEDIDEAAPSEPNSRKAGTLYMAS